MPSRYHIGVFRDQPLPGYVVFRQAGDTPDSDEEAQAEYLREFYSRDQAESLKTHLEQVEKAEQLLSARHAPP